MWDFFQWKSYSVGFLSKSVGFPRRHIVTPMRVARHFQASASRIVLLRLLPGLRMAVLPCPQTRQRLSTPLTVPPAIWA